MENDPNEIEIINSIREKWEAFDVPYDENRHMELVTYGATHSEIAMLFFATVKNNVNDFTKIFLKSEEGQNLKNNLNAIDRSERVVELGVVKKNISDFLEEKSKLAGLMLMSDLDIPDDKLKSLKDKLLRIEELIDLENQINGKD